MSSIRKSPKIEWFVSTAQRCDCVKCLFWTISGLEKRDRRKISVLLPSCILFTPTYSLAWAMRHHSSIKRAQTTREKYPLCVLLAVPIGAKCNHIFLIIDCAQRIGVFFEPNSSRIEIFLRNKVSEVMNTLKISTMNNFNRPTSLLVLQYNVESVQPIQTIMNPVQWGCQMLWRRWILSKIRFFLRRFLFSLTYKHC